MKYQGLSKSAWCNAYLGVHGTRFLLFSKRVWGCQPFSCSGIKFLTRQLGWSPLPLTHSKPCCLGCCVRHLSHGLSYSPCTHLYLTVIIQACVYTCTCMYSWIRCWVDLYVFFLGVFTYAKLPAFICYCSHVQCLWWVHACVCVCVCVCVCARACVCVVFICIVQHNWACLMWKSATKKIIYLLLLLLLSLRQLIDFWR